MAAAVIPDSNGNLHEINTEVRGSLFTAERRNFRETRRPNDAHTGYGKIARPALVIAHTVARVYRSISTVSGRSWGGGGGRKLPLIDSIISLFFNRSSVHRATHTRAYRLVRGSYTRSSVATTGGNWFPIKRVAGRSSARARARERPDGSLALWHYQ